METPPTRPAYTPPPSYANGRHGLAPPYDPPHLPHLSPGFLHMSAFSTLRPSPSRRHAAVLLVLLCAALYACDEDTQQNTLNTTQSDTPTDTSPSDSTEPSPFAFPTIQGWPTLEDLNPDPKIVEVNLTARSLTSHWPSDLTLRMMTYNGVTPGPLLQVAVGDRVIVHFKNELDEPTTVHWHGLRIPADMDGNPRIQDPVEPGTAFTYDFVVPDAGTFWYHPHIRANEQVEKGLYGPLIVHDPADPVVDQERIMPG